MKKNLLIMAFVCNAFSATFFCHPGLATGNNDGTSTDNAWQSVVTAFAATSMDAGDTMYIRRIRAAYSADLAPNASEDGTLTDWYHIVGCPRDTVTGTADFHQGYRVITNLSITPDFYHHATRTISHTANNRSYTISTIAHKIDFDEQSENFTIGDMITDGTSGAIGKLHYQVDNGTDGSLWVVVQSGTFGDNNEITGATSGTANVTGTPDDDGFVTIEKYADADASGGNFVIDADEYYEEFLAINDAAWTIKVSDWDDDDDSMPKFDFGAGAYNLYNNGAYMWRFSNLAFTGGTENGSVYLRSSSNQIMSHCIIEQSNNVNGYYTSSSSVRSSLINCIIKGSSSGNGQIGHTATNGTFNVLRNCAIYNMGDHGINCEYGEHYLYNCNIGVDLPNDDDDLVLGNHDVYCQDCEFGELNGGVMTGLYYRNQFFSYNHNKTWGDNRQYLNQGYFIKKAVIAESGDPEKRSGGNDFVIAITENSRSDGYSYYSDMQNLVFTQAFIMDTVPRNYRFYCQANAMSTTSDQVKIEIKYCSQINGTASYYIATALSDEAINTRSGADDWTQYVEITNIEPDTTGLIQINFYADFYDDDGILYVDPKCIISEAE